MAATDNGNGAEPACNAAAITPHNTNTLTYVTRAIYVGVAGDVKVDMVGLTGSGVTFSNLPVGIHPLRVTKVYSTGTTATNLVALW